MGTIISSTNMLRGKGKNRLQEIVHKLINVMHRGETSGFRSNYAWVMKSLQQKDLKDLRLFNIQIEEKDIPYVINELQRYADFYNKIGTK